METTALAAATTKPIAPPKAPISSDFNTFLKMLTTQMQNQDPLNPIDSADYAVQLATFSGVEQQTKTNQLLDSLIAQFGVMGMSQLAAWVGQEARAAGPVWKGDDPVTLTYPGNAHADRAVLLVKNQAGDLMTREDLPLGGGPYQWLGGDVGGNPLSKGLYNLSVENYRDGKQLGEPAEVEAYAQILEARGGPSGTTLVLEGGVEVAATEITALRMP